MAEQLIESQGSSPEKGSHVFEKEAQGAGQGEPASPRRRNLFSWSWAENEVHFEFVLFFTPVSFTRFSVLSMRRHIYQPRRLNIFSLTARRSISQLKIHGHMVGGPHLFPCTGRRGYHGWGLACDSRNEQSSSRALLSQHGSP